MVCLESKQVVFGTLDSQHTAPTAGNNPYHRGRQTTDGGNPFIIFSSFDYIKMNWISSIFRTTKEVRPSSQSEVKCNGYI